MHEVLKELLALTLDQADHVVHLDLPVLEFANHYLQVAAAQVSGEDPCDVDDLLHLINVALDELETHCLHKHELDVELVQLTVSGDAVELEAAVVLVNLEEKLQETDDPHLLVKVGDLAQNGRETTDVVGVGLDGTLELGYLPSA